VLGGTHESMDFCHDTEAGRQLLLVISRLCSRLLIVSSIALVIILLIIDQTVNT